MKPCTDDCTNNRHVGCGWAEKRMGKKKRPEKWVQLQLELGESKDYAG